MLSASSIFCADIPVVFTLGRLVSSQHLMGNSFGHSSSSRQKKSLKQRKIERPSKDGHLQLFSLRTVGQMAIYAALPII